jgi:hypothetical protein
MNYKILLMALLIILPMYVLAAGSGSGGSTRDAEECTQDIWQCTSWSRCGPDRLQYRNCTLTYDCESVNTQKPYETVTCQYVSEIIRNLRCTNQETMRERIACRLRLSDEDLAKELEISYLPEECRGIMDGREKDDCVKLYAQSRPCWRLEMGDLRNGCLREILNLTDINTHRENCRSMPGCAKELRTRVYALAKFKIYDLEERAEDMMELGLITEEEAAGIITKLENHKLLFNEATNRDERIIVLNNVKADWKEFMDDVRSRK